MPLPLPCCCCELRRSRIGVDTPAPCPQVEPLRKLSDFAMPSDPEEARQLQAVLDDFKDFVGRVRWYSARGVPYRRGYLLYGSPGCGKTTFTKVLAGRVGSDLYVLDLKSAAKIGVNDANISDIVRSLPPRSILLLKNIDASVCKRGSKGAQDDAKTTAAADKKDRKEEETGAKMDAKKG